MPSRIEHVTAELRRMVLSSELAPGQRVVELELASRLGVSRTPLRLAFGELAREGLFERLPTRGFRVRRVTLEEVAQAIDVRGVLEGLAARTAAESGLSEEALQELLDCVDEGRAVLEAAASDGALDTPRWVEMNVRFHAALVQAAASPVLAATVEQVTRTPLAAPGAIALGGVRPALELAFLQRAQADHEDIVQALRAREGARAEALLREHARRSRDNKRVLIRDGVDLPQGGAAVTAAERGRAPTGRGRRRAEPQR